MKTAFDIISKFFYRTFCIFSLLTLAVCGFGMLFHVQDLSSKIIFSFLGFSLMLSVSFLIGDFIKNNAVLRNAVKFVLSYFSVVVIFFLGGPLAAYTKAQHLQNKGFSVLAVSLVYVLIYAAIGLVVLLFNFIKNKILNNKTNYEKMFK